MKKPAHSDVATLGKEKQALDHSSKFKQNKDDLILDSKWSEVKIYGKNISRRSYHSSVFYEDRMYLYGGYEVNEGILSDFCEMMVVRNQVFQWQKVRVQDPTQSPGPLMRHTAVVYGDKMYIFGGNKHSLHSSNTLYSYDFNEEIWAIVPTKDNKTPGRLDSHSAAVDEENKCMYIFGGFSDQNEGGYQNKLWKFNFETSEWILLAANSQKVPSKRAGASIAQINSTLYMFGGTVVDMKFNDLWAFDLATEEWAEIEAAQGDVVPETRNGHSLMRYKDKLVLFGGIHDITHEKNDMHIFDIASKKWTLIDSNTSHSQSEKNDDLLHSDNHNLQNESAGRLLSPENHKKQLQSSMMKTKDKLAGPGSTNKSLLIPVLAQQNESVVSKEETTHSGNQMEEKKKRRQLMKKMNLLQEFELKNDEKIALRPVSPTTETMKASIATVGNPIGKNKFNLKASDNQKTSFIEAAELKQQNLMVGKRPCARDGHSALLCENLCFIFGGDRHMMSYNDLFCVDLDKVVSS